MKASWVFAWAFLFWGVVALGQDQPPTSAPATAPTGNSTQALAEKLQNPVANLISVPFQNNLDFDAGAKNGIKYTLNVQPVIPFSLNDNWNLITRTIVPLTFQENLVEDAGYTQWGLGDVQQSFFFAPKYPTADGLIWGAGPVFLWPSGTNDSLGSGKWGAGPTGLLLWQKHGWTYGALVNHIWSYAGDGDRENVNVTFLQPFLAYTFPTATTLGINLESSYDWNANQWTVPINLQLSQVVKFGKMPVSFQGGVRYYAAGPPGTPDWGVRFTMTLLLPK
jgi:hypothetical protein